MPNHSKVSYLSRVNRTHTFRMTKSFLKAKRNPRLTCWNAVVFITAFIMGQQHRKVVKRQRRKAYLARKKAKVVTGKPVATGKSVAKK